ncbi:MAG: hypothetical protein AB1634_04195 [Thermodesulfobacteriota bacterium]
MPRRLPPPTVALALTAILVVGSQVAIIAAQGEALCLNTGCRIVEGLTAISPLAFNLLGLAYFAAVLGLARMGAGWAGELLGPLLFAGAAVEGVLTAYQGLAVGVWCSYCLLVAGLVVLLNLSQGWRHALAAAFVLAAPVAIMAALSFGPGLTMARLGAVPGVAAVRPAAAGRPQADLFVAASCPHCEKLLQDLPAFPDCTIQLRPVDQLAALPAGLAAAGPWQPEGNRLLLALLGVETVPALLVQEEEGIRLLKGRPRIEAWLAAACQPPPAAGEAGQSLMDLDEDGECPVAVECPPP